MNPADVSKNEAESPEKPRILVVDDEPGIQRSVTRILARHYEVQSASSGDEALDILKQQYHNLAVVDVRMPGMNGFELLSIIKQKYPATEVIIMTGSISNPEENLVEAIQKHAFYFINKPFEKTVLETLVNRCLELQRLERVTLLHTQELEKDLERARAFQQLLLPTSFPRIQGLRGDVHYEPSERVGGDFYDFFALEKTKLGVVIADVAGHGVSAALFTGMLKSEMRAVRDEWRYPENLFNRINNQLVPLTRNQFITAILAIVDIANHTIRYVSAGHPSFFLSNGEACESTGTPLGMIKGWAYEAKTVNFKPGERVLLYTDGLPEALGPGDTEFGLDQLQTAFLDAAHRPPDEILSSVVGAARSFTRHASFEDDVTAILLECLS